MPRTTHAYPFENKVWAYACSLAGRLGGDPHRRFRLVLDDDGHAEAIYFGDRSEVDDRTKTRSELFYDPFDVPEYAWLAWSKISRATMERLMGQAFEETDFEPFRNVPNSGSVLNPSGVFPESWGVMF